MKKYKMRIKDKNAGYVKYGIDVYREEPNEFLWLCESSMESYKYSHSYLEKDGKYFTMEEIEKMPYGFVNQYDLIEVKEQLYYIKLPHLTGEYLYINYDPQSKEVAIDAKYECAWIKTKFTKQEIEEKFPFYANETCMVKVEEDE